MKTTIHFAVVSLLFVVVFGVAAGPAHGVIEATRVSDLGGGKIVAMYSWNGGLWLGVENGQHGEIWLSDGTAAGTVHIKDLPETSVQDHWMTIGGVVEAGNAMIFDYSEVYEEYGWINVVTSSIWLSDGTAAGTLMLPDSADLNMDYIGKLENITCFHTLDSALDLDNLWRSDGTLGGTSVFKSNLHAWGGSELGNILYFHGSPSSHISSSLWRTDGTADGTFSLQPAGETYIALVEMGNILYFWGKSSAGPNRLFRSDGTIEGTYTLQPDGSTCGGDLFIVGDVVCFCGATSAGAPGLFRSDGTVPGTYRIAEIAPETFNISEIAVPGDMAIFDVNVSMAESLWRTDGTAEGTIRLMDGYAHHLTVFDDAVYFLADETGGTGLWRTDGTIAGTVLVFHADLWGDPGMVALDERLLFWCQYVGIGVDLYASDGTAAGTVLVDTPWPAEKQAPAKTMPPPPINQIWSQNGVINISCYSGSTLARLSGTQVQTVQLHDSALGVTDGASASIGSRPLFLGDTEYFCGRNSGLWAAGFRFTKTPHAPWSQVGDPLLLAVECAGYVGAISYQWFKDGGLIDGATSAEFRIDSLAEDDEGWYSCRVTDTAKAIHETEPVFVQVFAPGELPATGAPALCAIAATCAASALGAFRRKKT